MLFGRFDFLSQLTRILLFPALENNNPRPSSLYSRTRSMLNLGSFRSNPSFGSLAEEESEEDLKFLPERDDEEEEDEYDEEERRELERLRRRRRQSEHFSFGAKSAAPPPN